MKLLEILSNDDLAQMIAKILMKSKPFASVDTHEDFVTFTTKKGVEGQIRAISDTRFLLTLQSMDGEKEVDMGECDSVEEIIEVMQDIEKGPKKWFRDMI